MHQPGEIFAVDVALGIPVPDGWENFIDEAVHHGIERALIDAGLPAETPFIHIETIDATVEDGTYWLRETVYALV